MEAMSIQTLPRTETVAIDAVAGYPFHRVESPLTRDAAVSLVAPDNRLRVLLEVDPHDLVDARAEHPTDMPELDVLAGLTLTESDHGLVVVCSGTWDVVGYAGDGKVEITFSFDYFASLDEDEAFEGLDDNDDEHCDDIYDEDGIGTAGVTDLPWPELEQL